MFTVSFGRTDFYIYFPVEIPSSETGNCWIQVISHSYTCAVTEIPVSVWNDPEEVQLTKMWLSASVPLTRGPGEQAETRGLRSLECYCSIFFIGA